MKVATSRLPDDAVVDPFNGAGSTVIACERIQRVCYAIDLDPTWCDWTIQRWVNYTGEKAVKL